MQDPLEQGKTNSEQRSHSYTLVGFFRGQLRGTGHGLVWISGFNTYTLSTKWRTTTGQITCFAKFNGIDIVNQPTSKAAIRAPCAYQTTNEALTFPWSASSRAHLLAEAHQVLWCLLNEDIWNPSYCREDSYCRKSLASGTVMRWKVLSQPAHLYRAGFLLRLGRLFVVWSKQAL